jgi:hypothetical protein
MGPPPCKRAARPLARTVYLGGYLWGLLSDPRGVSAAKSAVGVVASVTGHASKCKSGPALPPAPASPAVRRRRRVTLTGTDG